MNSERWQPVTVDKIFGKDPRAWLTRFMNTEMPWLLAHADDGVIWGKLQDDGVLKLSSDVYNNINKYPALAVPLRAETLQQVRLFGPASELFLWRSDSGFAARMISDGSFVPDDAFEESHLLWGDRECEIREGFTTLVEGQMGLTHAPPVIRRIRDQRAALIVRHYVDYDEQDQAYVYLSRLVSLHPMEQQEAINE